MERIETSPEQLTRIARKTLAILREWNAPLTPENYHLFFEYVKGQNQELSTDMDLEANSGGAFNTATTARLYDKHIRGQSGLYESEQVRKELAPGLVVGVGYIISGSGALSGDLTYSSHCTACKF